MTKFIDFVPKRPQQAVIKHPVTEKPVAEKPVAEKPLTKKPAVKKPLPAQPIEEHPKPKTTPSRLAGRRMDFVRRPASAPLPTVKVQKKTVKISVSSHPAPMPELRSAAKTSKPSPRPMPKMKPASRPISVIRPASKPMPRPVPRPTVRPVPEPELEPELDVEPLMDDDELSLALAGFADDDDSPSLMDNLSKEATDLEDELDALDELDAISDDLEAEIADFVEEPKPMFAEKKPDAPDANKYSLGGRSPFLSSVRVEKRPLSGFVPDSTKTLRSEAKTPVKNSYRAKIKQAVTKVRDEKSDAQPPRRRETTIISTPKNHANSIGLTIAIILTIILGAAIGAVIYLVFFQ